MHGFYQIKAPGVEDHWQTAPLPKCIIILWITPVRYRMGIEDVNILMLSDWTVDNIPSQQEKGVLS